jgi:CRISPR/Cas system-associated protein endoribonuclease Cas2
MKKILCVIVILFAVSGVFAQEKKITQSEFEAIYKAAFTKFKSEPYRVITVRKNSYDGAQSYLQTEAANSSSFSLDTSMRVPSTDNYTQTMPTITETHRLGDKIYSPVSKTTFEFVSPSVYRQIFESDSSQVLNLNSINTFNPINTKIETITIGDKFYVRVGDGKWRQGKTADATQLKDESAAIEEKSQYKYLGKDKLDGQDANVYEKTVERKTIAVSNRKKMLIKTTEKYWFGENGELLKVKSESKGKSRSASFNAEFETIYEIDPNIKIEEPK